MWALGGSLKGFSERTRSGLHVSMSGFLPPAAAELEIKKTEKNKLSATISLQKAEDSVTRAERNEEGARASLRSARSVLKIAEGMFC